MKPWTLHWIVVLGLWGAGAVLVGCAPSVDASKAYTRGTINRGAIVPAESVRVGEYLNYYQQRFPEPVDQPLGMDLRLGNTFMPLDGGEMWVQIGLQARRGQPSMRTPLNLALVLDTSGSMAAGDKMPYLKQSLLVFLDSLQPDDEVAIVVYSTEAHVLRRSQPVGDGRWIRNVVESLSPGGNTNLYDGLMAGFDEVQHSFDLRRNNRLILLTDGRANTGVTSADSIAAGALAYNQQGIYLSTIGLGMDMNDPLLSELARQGKGAYHFVDSTEEMDKIFRQEVEGLVEQVAGDIRLSIRPLDGVKLASVTGFEGQPPARGAQVDLPPMGAGDSQVVMACLQVGPGPGGIRQLVEIDLEYSDLFARQARRERGVLTVTAANGDGFDPLADVEVRRNATIVQSAEALKAIDALFTQGRYAEAWALANAMEARLRTVAAQAGDSQMVQDADLFRRYQITLAGALGYDPASESTSMPDNLQQPQRWGATPLPDNWALPTIELR
jgi:uncharacterized protein YegL